MNGLAGPFLWLAGITTRAISSVMSVCHKFGTLAPKSINITATTRYICVYCLLFLLSGGGSS